MGAGRSILIDKNGNIIAGNKSQAAAIKAGITKVRIIETTGDELVAVKRTDVDIDSPIGRKLALGDNATSQVNLAWDETELRSVADQLEGFDPGFFGIDPANLPEPYSPPSGGSLKTPPPANTEEDDFDQDKDKVAPVCQAGDIWQLGNHRLMCGDSSDAEQFKVLMQDGKVKADMVFTDPPYGVSIGDKNAELNTVQPSGRCCENIKNDTLSVTQLYEVLKLVMINVRENCAPDASYYVCAPPGGDMGLMMMMMMRDAGLNVRHQIVWNKNSATFSIGRLDYDYKHEAIMYTWTDKHHNYRKGAFRTSVWDIDKPRKCDLHPTMKPVVLVANCLLDGTQEGDVVLDAFGGSGTTLIAAEQLGRKAYLMELDPRYCDVIIARWEKLTGQKAVKL